MTPEQTRVRLTGALAHLAALLLEAARALLGPLPAEARGGLLVTGVALGATLHFEQELELSPVFEAEVLERDVLVREELVAQGEALRGGRHEGHVFDDQLELGEGAGLVNGDGHSLPRGSARSELSKFKHKGAYEKGFEWGPVSVGAATATELFTRR